MGFSRLSVVVVGLGSIGNRHLQNLLRLGVGRVAVVRRRQSNPAFRPPSGVEVFLTLGEALAWGADAAVVCTPTALHRWASVACLESGCPVLVEKPLAHTLDDAQAILQAQARTGTPAWMAYCMRFHPAWQLAQQALDQGRLPPVQYFKIWYECDVTRWHPWEDFRQSYAVRQDLGGGVVPTLDHEIDLALWCFGPPQEVRGRAFCTWLGCPVPDTCWSDWHYRRGPQGLVWLSFARRDRTRGFEFITQHGTLHAELIHGVLRWIPAQQEAASELWWHDPQYDWNQMYLELMQAFLTAVCRGKPPAVPLQAGWEALQVCHQILEGAAGS